MSLAQYVHISLRLQRELATLADAVKPIWQQRPTGRSSTETGHLRDCLNNDRNKIKAVINTQNCLLFVCVGVEASVIIQRKPGFHSSFSVYLCVFWWYSHSALSGCGYCILNTKLNGVCCLFLTQLFAYKHCHFGQSCF